MLNHQLTGAHANSGSRGTLVISEGIETIAAMVDADAWFNIVSNYCAFGATCDGCGGDGDEPVRVLIHVQLKDTSRFIMLYP